MPSHSILVCSDKITARHIEKHLKVFSHAHIRAHTHTVIHTFFVQTRIIHNFISALRSTYRGQEQHRASPSPPTTFTLRRLNVPSQISLFNFHIGQHRQCQTHSCFRNATKYIQVSFYNDKFDTWGDDVSSDLISVLLCPISKSVCHWIRPTRICFLWVKSMGIWCECKVGMNDTSSFSCQHLLWIQTTDASHRYGVKITPFTLHISNLLKWSGRKRTRSFQIGRLKESPQQQRSCEMMKLDWMKIQSLKSLKNNLSLEDSAAVWTWPVADFILFHYSPYKTIYIWGKCLEYKKGTAICYSKYDFPSLVHAVLKYKLHFLFFFQISSFSFFCIFFSFLSFLCFFIIKHTIFFCQIYT